MKVLSLRFLGPVCLEPQAGASHAERAANEACGLAALALAVVMLHSRCASPLPPYAWAPDYTVDGRNPAPPKTPWETIVCWYLHWNHHARVSEVVQDFVHPLYFPRVSERVAPGSSLVLRVHRTNTLCCLYANPAPWPA